MKLKSWLPTDESWEGSGRRYPMIRMTLNAGTDSRFHVKPGLSRVGYSRLDRIRTGAGKGVDNQFQMLQLENPT